MLTSVEGPPPEPHLPQDEFINAFDNDGLLKAIRNSVSSKRHYLCPPDPTILMTQNRRIPANAYFLSQPAHLPKLP